MMNESSLPARRIFYLLAGTLVTLALVGCSEESSEDAASPSPNGQAALTAKEVGAYLDQETGFSTQVYEVSENRAMTAYKDADVSINVYRSSDALATAQANVEKEYPSAEAQAALPTEVTCGQIQVDVAADETPDRTQVEQDYADKIQKALKRKYDCSA